MLILHGIQDLSHWDSDTFPPEIFKELLFDAYQVERQFDYPSGQPRRFRGIYVAQTEADEEMLEDEYRLSEQAADWEDATEAEGQFWEKHVYTIDGETVIIYWQPKK